MKTSQALLSQHKLRRTPFRLKVLELFMDSPHAAKSNSVLESKLGDHDRITLYRTIKSFQEKGLIHLVVDGSNEPKYALCHDDCDIHKAELDHPHFHCETCGETYCLDNVPELNISLPKDYQLTKVHLALTGVCSECR